MPPSIRPGEGDCKENRTRCGASNGFDRPPAAARHSPYTVANPAWKYDDRPPPLNQSCHVAVDLSRAACR